MSQFLHRWLSLIIVLQVLIWVATGLYFNLVDSAWYNTTSYQKQTVTESQCDSNIIPVSELTLSAAATKIELRDSNQGCHYLVHYNRVFHHYQAMQVQIFDAHTGQALPALTKDAAVVMANDSYTGPGSMIAINLLPPGTSSNGKQQNPVWRADFNDEQQTRVYLHSVTREVIRHETQNARFHQWMFRLHFMDYVNSGDFSHPLIISFALMTLLSFISGIIWLVRKIRSGKLAR